MITLLIGQGFGQTTAHGSDERIGSAEINAGSESMLVGRSGLSGFADLQ